MWMGPEEVRAIVREYATKGMDFLKYGSSGHTEMSFICFSPRVQRAIVEEAHRAGMTVQVHTTSVESLDMAIEAGVDIITHGEISGPTVPIPDETIGKLVDRGMPASVLPVTQKRIDALVEAKSMMAPFMTVAAQNLEKMIEAGVTLLLSTDAGIEHPVYAAESKEPKVDSRVRIGEGHFNALVGLEERGMAPMEILQTATSNIAQAYEVDAEIGTLEAGKMADLVILDDNPLESAANYRGIHTVIKGGKVVDLDALPIAPIISSQTPPEE
jgi:imidazolonepropionase-like amidohydrolase